MSERIGLGYKQTELGELPNEWGVVRLREMAPCDSQPRPAKEVDEALPYVGLEHIESATGRLITTSLPRAHSMESNVYLFGASDVLYGRLRPYLNKVLVTDFQGTCTTELIPLHCSDALDRRFLGYFLVSPCFVDYAVRHSQGTRMPRVAFDALWNAPIPFPPLPEQRRIAGALRLVDETIDRTRRLVESYQRLKKVALRRLLTRGIGHARFKQTELGELPEEWVVKPLGSLMKEVYRYPTYYNIEYVNEGTPEIRGELLAEDGEIESDPSKLRYISKETAARFPRTQLAVGDVVISVRGTMGKVGIVRPQLEGGNITANLMRLSPDGEVIHSEFLKHFLLSDVFQSALEARSSQTTIKTIQAPVLKGMPVPLPPLEEQQEIAEHLDRLEHLIKNERRYVEALAKLKRLWMGRLLTGKVRVPPEAEPILQEALPNGGR